MSLTTAVMVSALVPRSWTMMKFPTFPSTMSVCTRSWAARPSAVAGGVARANVMIRPGLSSLAGGTHASPTAGPTESPTAPRCSVAPWSLSSTNRPPGTGTTRRYVPGCTRSFTPMDFTAPVSSGEASARYRCWRRTTSSSTAFDLSKSTHPDAPTSPVVWIGPSSRVRTSGASTHKVAWVMYGILITRLRPTPAAVPNTVTSTTTHLNRTSAATRRRQSITPGSGSACGGPTEASEGANNAVRRGWDTWSNPGAGESDVDITARYLLEVDVRG